MHVLLRWIAYYYQDSFDQITTGAYVNTLSLSLSLYICTYLQSLSAAHLLATQHSASEGVPQTKSDPVPPSPVKDTALPPEFQSLLESCRADEVIRLKESQVCTHVLYIATNYNYTNNIL